MAIRIFDEVAHSTHLKLTWASHGPQWTSPTTTDYNFKETV